MVDFRVGLYMVDFTWWTSYGDFTWTSYSMVYMIIKNEVKFILTEDNLNLII